MNSELLRVSGYLFVAAVCLIAWQSERGMREPENPGLWPNMWLFTAFLLFGFAVARAIGAPSLVTDIGRDEAQASGLYDARRGFQAVLVATVALAWFAAVVTAVWRVPERRRRYLPAIIVVMAVVAFAAIRVVSLHHVDQVLYNHPVQGVRGVVYVELGLLVMLGGLATLRTLTLARTSEL